MKKRLDQLVVDRKLAPTRSQAQARILAGEVLVRGVPSPKAGLLLPEDAEVRLATEGPRYVSRGGIKLAGALDHFGIHPKGWVCLDVGASTGGFTDCLLQRGAVHVYTVDVGRGQLDPRIRNDARVTWKESFHARDLHPRLFPELADLAVVDVSFISLRKILKPTLDCIRSGGVLLALIKPQFEAQRKDVRKGGVLRDESKRQEIFRRMTGFVTAELGLLNPEIVDSCLAGPKGNREAFLKAEKS